MEGQESGGDVAAQAVSHGWKLIDQYPAVGLLLVGIGVAWWLLKRNGNGNGHATETNSTHVFAHMDEKLDNILEAQETNRKEVRGDIKELFGIIGGLAKEVAGIDKRVVVIEEHREQWDTGKPERRARS